MHTFKFICSFLSEPAKSIWDKAMATVYSYIHI